MITRYGVWKWTYFGGGGYHSTHCTTYKGQYSLMGSEQNSAPYLRTKSVHVLRTGVVYHDSQEYKVSQPVKWSCYHSPASDEPMNLISADLSFLICEISFLQIFFSMRSSLIILSRLYQFPVLTVLIILHSIYQILTCYLQYLFISLLSCSPNTKEAPERQIFLLFCSLL